MGNCECSCKREDYEAAKKYSTDKYSIISKKAVEYSIRAKDFTIEKTNEAKIQYAPQLEYAKIKYDAARLKMLGYTPPIVDDKSEMGMISFFERRLQFGKVDTNEFERRLKKLSDPTQNDMISMKQIEASFKDHYAFREINVEGSVSKAILTHKILKKDPNSDLLYIPYVVMLGILYCASNNELKVQKFYEGCQIQLDPSIDRKDPELLELVPKLIQIAYELMLDVYIDKKLPEDPDTNESFVLNESQKKTIYQALTDDIVKEWFGKQQVLTKEDFCTRLMKTADRYLMPHSLRILVRKKMKELNM